MKPKDTFLDGRRRAEHLLKLAELLTDTRKRKMRADWAENFKKLMHWPKKEIIDRVDGRGAILILRGAKAPARSEFTEEYTSELLRAAHTTVVAALDRYCHELIMSNLIGAIKRREPKLQTLSISLFDAHAAVQHAHKPATRPMNLVKKAVQGELFKQTFQSPNKIAEGLAMLGIKSLWSTCAVAMDCKAKDIEDRLKRIVARRNRIVHEGDLKVHVKGGGVRRAKIAASKVGSDIEWVGRLVDAIEDAADAALTPARPQRAKAAAG